MQPARDIPRLVVAGVASGVGKTTVAVALGRALGRRGLRVAPFKCGPDYLDPTYHRRACGRDSHNLDGWMMGRRAVLDTFARESAGADIALIEGVMGLYDGASPVGDAGSSAEIARWLDAPVLLVVDASGMARSLAAVAHGYATFDRRITVAGVVANRVGSRGHLDLLRRALHAPPIVGGFPKRVEHAFPERHLGLHAADGAVDDELLDAWAAAAREWLDLDAIARLARGAPPLAHEPPPAPPLPERRCRIGVARDAAFHFYYPDNLGRLEQHGAELVPFSPLCDRSLPDVDGVYIGGGYPEAHAAGLAANRSLHADLAALAASGAPIYAECGGLMFLARSLTAADGGRHEMAGLLPLDVRVFDRRRALGYVEVETRADSILGGAGTRFRGHEFRYSEIEEAGEVEHLYTVRRRRGDTTRLEGYRAGTVIGSYVHAHWGSNEAPARAFIDACARRRAR